MMEVESKFEVRNLTNLFSKLEELGAVEVIEKLDQAKEEPGFTLEDVYFDDPVGHYPLMTNDLWLRKRNGRWQLKAPLIMSTSARSPLERDVTSYVEVDDDEKAIFDRIKFALTFDHDVIDSLKTLTMEPPSMETPPAPPPLTPETLSMSATSMSAPALLTVQSRSRPVLMPVVEFSSTRRRFQIGGGGSSGSSNGGESGKTGGGGTAVVDREAEKKSAVEVHVDSASFGFSLVEIEKMVEKDSEIPSAKLEIVNLAKELGIDSHKTNRGKVEKYLELHNPELLQTLEEKGILSKASN